MTSALEVIASGGLTQVAAASLRVLELIAVIVLPALALRSLLRRRRARKTPTQPNPVAEFWARDCPWCDTHDGTVCNCERPCASWICAAKAVDRG